MRAPLPDYEQERLAELRKYGILDTDPEEAYDRITRIAAQLFGAPIALVSLVDAERQWFKSAYGLDIREMSRDLAFSAYAIMGEGPMVVLDPEQDERFRDNELVTGPAHMRFYAGVPLVAAGGQKLGTLCVIDSRRRETPERGQLEALGDLAAMVVELLETRLANRAVAEERRRYAQMFTKNPAPAWIVNAETDEIVEANRAAEMLYGYSAREWEGMRWGDLKAGEEEGRERHRKRDGKWIEVEVSSEALDLADGRRRVVVGFDVTSRERALEELRESSKYIDRIHASVPCMIYTFDVRRRRPLRISESAGRLLGYAPGVTPMLGGLIHEEDVARVNAHLRSFPRLKDGESVDFYYRLQHVDGSWRWMLSRDTILERDENGNATVLLGIATDVTERQEAAAALQVAKERAEAATRAKSEFLATISHEIRTPLNSIIGLASVLGQTELAEQQKQYVRALESSGEALLLLLNDLLDLSKIEAGRMELESHWFIPRELAEDAVSLFATTAEKKGLRLEVELGSEMKAECEGDSLRVRQILLNFLSNAVKFTERGSVRVVGRVEETGNLLLAVEDTGIGLNEEQLSRLFQHFRQADATTTRKFGGTGLGLTISRKLAKLMGGEIGAESREGEGSRFWVRLPVSWREATGAAVREKRVRQERLAPDGRIGEKKRLLVAEDNFTNQIVIEAMLNMLGYEVDIVGNGLLAVEAYETGVYDAVLMDCQMPEMDGWEATRRIREIENGGKGRIPILALTANVMEGEREKCLGGGMDDYLCKPVQMRDLELVLGRWVRNYEI